MTSKECELVQMLKIHVVWDPRCTFCRIISNLFQNAENCTDLQRFAGTSILAIVDFPGLAQPRGEKSKEQRARSKEQGAKSAKAVFSPPSRLGQEQTTRRHDNIIMPCLSQFSVMQHSFFNYGNQDFSHHW